MENILSHLLDGLYEREEAVRLSLLAALSGKSIFYLGPPGVAKSLIARKIASAFKDADFFEYLMGRFSTPDEIFGPVSIARLKHEDSYSRNIEGYLPGADIVFLDEIWKSSPPIQNTLLAALNERTFRNGDELIKIPMKCFIAASNEIKDDDESRAFWDRFLIRLEITAIRDPEFFKDLIRTPSDPEITEAPLAITPQEWSQWLDSSRTLRLSDDLVGMIGALRQSMNTEASEDGSFFISDRRWKQIAELLQTSAYFHGRNEANMVDAFIIPHCIWNNASNRQRVEEIFSEEISRMMFNSSINVIALQQKVESLKDAVNSRAYDDQEVTQFIPVRYDGEYFRFIPDQGNGDEDYRVWADDLEYLDERGELELFVYKSGNFYRTEVHPMRWTDKENWKLSGGPGSGIIEHQNEKTFTRVARELSTEDRKILGQEYRNRISRLEAAISHIDAELASCREQGSTHLFIPSHDLSPLMEGGRDKKQSVQQLLAEVLEIGRQEGLEEQDA
ncbi:AAA family ATPase [Salinispira pacifica]|uniref:AAA family ATPase n=1 Tax=Salinispira pacifica TaxID=1307761 RepID=UPI00146FA451|nr:AAA family ATPase [Salinispira pacifica]